MSLHVFGAIVTHLGTAANNRAETDGNITTLQKLLWQGKVHSSVSAEAIRFALRRRLAVSEPTNRTWDEDERVNSWKDHTFKQFGSGKGFIDDDLLGFMSADAAKEENTKGSAKVRRAVLEITRAISLIPYGGDVTFNAASPGATPSAQKKGSNPVPYGTEVHATRYQFGFAMTPGSLQKPERAETAIKALGALGEVAGNHGRFLYDFSPESVVFRITQDPAPRLLYIFEEKGSAIRAPRLVDRVKAGDIKGEELIIGGQIAETEEAKEAEKLGAKVVPGVRKAADLACERIAKGG